MITISFVLMHRSRLALAALLSVKLCSPFVLIHPVYELHRDEFLHLDQAHHMAWGYDSLPPFTSWISWVIMHAGNTEFLIKFFPALFVSIRQTTS